MTSTANHSPVTELHQYAVEFKGRCKVAGWFGALFHAEVVCDIVKDVEGNQIAIGDRAYSAEQSDLEAAKLIDDVLSDGIVTVEEVQKLKKALRFIRNSAEADHNITNLARLEA